MTDAMPLCSNCQRQPSQIAEIVWAAKEEGLDPDEFILKYRADFGLDQRNRFLCVDCREKLAS